MPSSPPPREEFLTYVDGFVKYVDADDLGEFLERVAEDKRDDVVDLMQQFNVASQETHPDLPDGCEW